MFSKLVKAHETKEQAEKELAESIVELVTELSWLMDLKAPISEEKAREN